MRVMLAAYQEGLGESAFSARKTIPFEYSFRFSLSGVPGTTLSSPVTVSVESTFVAVSIGYGVIPAASTLTFGGRPTSRPVAAAAPAAARGKDSLVTTTFGDLIASIAPAVGEREVLLKGTIGPGTAA